MKICGFRKLDFVDKESGEAVSGFNIFQKIACDNGCGFYTEKHFISSDVANVFDITSDTLKDVYDNQKDILFDKVGKRIVGIVIL